MPPRLAEPQAHEASEMQSVLMRARDQSRYEAPIIEQPRAKRSFPWKPIAWLFGIVVVLAMTLGAVYALWLREPVVDPNTIVQVPEGSPSVSTRSPQDAVRGYLEALAGGDAETALSYGEVGGNGSRVLLTNAFHADMRAKAPIRDIQILTEGDDVTEVDVSYTMAGEQIQTTIPVAKDDSGNYHLARTTVTVVIELGQAESLPLLIEGVEVQKFTPLEVLPGVYELSTGLKFIEYPRENSFTIGSLQYADETTFPATPRLTSLGADAFRTAVQRSLDHCTRAQEPAPEGCPQGVTPAKPIVASTIQWHLVGNPLSQAEPSLSTVDLSKATMALDLSFSVSFDYADGSTAGTQPIAVTARATANMLGKDENQVAVVWQG